tara:strand:- start:1 stop:408 length:408 start_codon:yes stop_codon:yes gene_type:complete
MTDKKYEIKYAISSPERTDSGRPTSSRGLGDTFKVSASNVTEAKKRLRESNRFKAAVDRVSRRLNFQEERSPRVIFDKITEQSKNGKPKVVQESPYQRKLNAKAKARAGGGRAAAVNETMGRTPKDQIKKIIPKT